MRWRWARRGDGLHKLVTRFGVTQRVKQKDFDFNENQQKNDSNIASSLQMVYSDGFKPVYRVCFKLKEKNVHYKISICWCRKFALYYSYRLTVASSKVSKNVCIFWETFPVFQCRNFLNRVNILGGSSFFLRLAWIFGEITILSIRAKYLH